MPAALCLCGHAAPRQAAAARPLAQAASAACAPGRARRSPSLLRAVAGPPPDRAEGAGDRPAELRYFRKGIPIPARLVASGGGSGSNEGPRAIYTLRLTTGDERGAGLSDPQARVVVLLVDESGTALLHRISPLADPAEAAAEAAALCEAAGPAAACEKEAGTAPSASPSSSPPPPTRARFQRGAVDEVAFAGPALGALAAFIASPEAGTWQVDEATVTVHPLPGAGAEGERQSVHAAAPPAPVRFLLGATRAGDRGAAFAGPVPPGAVVVGSGDAAAILTPAQADALRAAGLEAYACLKDRALAAGGALVGGGALLLAAAAAARGEGGEGGAATVMAWLAGGGAGLAYGWALQSGVDAVGVPGAGRLGMTRPPSGDGEERERSPPPAPPLPFPARLVASPPARIALVAALGLAALGAATHGGGSGGVGAALSASHPGPARLALLRQLLTAAAGFSMYKVGLVATVAAADSGVAGPRRLRERAQREGGGSSAASSDDDGGSSDDGGGSRRAGAAAGGGGPGVDSSP